RSRVLAPLFLLVSLCLWLPTLFPYTTLFRSVRDQAMEAIQLEKDTTGKSLAVAIKSATGLKADRCHCSVLCLNGALLITSVRNIDRKSTRLNSSHVSISYAVFCLNKKTLDPT